MAAPRQELIMTRLGFGAALLIAVGALLSPAGVFAQGLPPEEIPVPYVPTEQPVVDKMLEMARVGKNDVVYDLGCGDGRIVITAAQKRGARGVGIDLNARLIFEAKANARRAGVNGQVEFVVGDIFATDFSKATVVMLYLLPAVNEDLRPQLWKQLKVGARIVSHDFDMGPEWPPERVVRLEGATLYFWTITPELKKALRQT
jgi:SAM-dependent methyltransferase